METTHEITKAQFRALLRLRNSLVLLPISVDIINMFDRVLDSIHTETPLEDDTPLENEDNLDLFKVNE